MKKKNNLKKYLKYFTLIFLFLMPIFDTIYFFNRYTTLIRIIIILVILLFTIICHPNSRKNLKWLFIYYAFCLGYFFINYYHALGFYSFMPDNIFYSGYTELLTILKLMVPITLIYVLYYQDINKKEYFLIIKSWIILIAGSIIALNLIKLSLSSYSTEIIKYSILEWHKGLYYAYTASRGLFVYANQEAVIMIMLFTMSIYLLLENKINVIYLIMLTFGMIMLGTRVSTLGIPLIIIASSFGYLYLLITHKTTFNKNFFLLIIPLIIWIFLIKIAPYSNRNVELNKVNNITQINPIKDVNSPNDLENTKNWQQKYVDLNHDDEKLPEIFYTKYYNYKYDSEFWYNFVKETPNEKLNYRYIETSIIKRVVDIDNRKSDILFGISNTRIQNTVNIERDFVEQYYAFGIIGSIILLLIYPVLFLISLKKFLINKEYINYLQLLSICLFIGISILTGNIINSVGTTIPFIFIVGKLKK
jgi:hypothetical protein